MGLMKLLSENRMIHHPLTIPRKCDTISISYTWNERFLVYAEIFDYFFLLLIGKMSK